MRKFKPGDTVVFTPSAFNHKYWNNLSEDEKHTYYGKFGYGKGKPELFTFLCEHRQQEGHCLLVRMRDGKLFPMCHTDEFRLATEEEA